MARRPLLLILLGALVTLPSLAFASPPDPTWIPGVYDEGDHDDVIVAVTSADSALDFATPGVSSFPIVLAILSLAATVGAPAREIPALQSRSPPTL